MDRGTLDRRTPAPRTLAFLRCVPAASLALCLAASGAPALAQSAKAKSAPVREAPQADFQKFLEALWPEARARGVARATFDEAFRGVAPDPKIIALTRKQSEFVRPIWDYIAGAAAPSRVAKGQEIAREWARVLDAVERTYDVPKGVVLGIWGMETNFGGFTGNIYVVRALATLAFLRYRGDFFRDEL